MIGPYGIAWQKRPVFFERTPKVGKAERLTISLYKKPVFIAKHLFVSFYCKNLCFFVKTDGSPLHLTNPGPSLLKKNTGFFDNSWAAGGVGEGGEVEGWQRLLVRVMREVGSQLSLCRTTLLTGRGGQWGVCRARAGGGWWSPRVGGERWY